MLVNMHSSLLKLLILSLIICVTFIDSKHHKIDSKILRALIQKLRRGEITHRVRLIFIRINNSYRFYLFRK